MNNAQFKIECFRNGLYSPEQIIEFYKVVHTEETKYNSRDAQLWINGKSSREYQIDPKAIQIVDMLNAIRSEVIAKEKERIKLGNPRYKYLFKGEQALWSEHQEFINLPVNFYNSIMVELGKKDLIYFEFSKKDIES
ncbi:hypothetical protein KTI62_15885 [Acinetobacter schindleri]|uniref:hypothetical protein n=1 Tax=Acinetobacter schindleri TaxID=108981 RepID=UPI0021CD595C|nr:hypothetical protein [Acinetobacter schindleri]MCU4521608.1 hypothetical protein [Acinetobacter schindleri]